MATLGPDPCSTIQESPRTWQQLISFKCNWSDSQLPCVVLWNYEMIARYWLLGIDPIASSVMFHEKGGCGLMQQFLGKRG